MFLLYGALLIISFTLKSQEPLKTNRVLIPSIWGNTWMDGFLFDLY